MTSTDPPSVLIVEDDAVLRSAYETVLTMEGYRAQTAADGLKALDAAETEEFDVILLDMLMPNLGGLEFLQAFEAKTKHPKTKIIVFSNMSVPSDVKDAMQLGATKYLTKSSFTPKEMESIITEVLTGE
jgi:CheY-like chemotaxis protein